MMRVLICGSRDWDDADPIQTVVAGLDFSDIIIHGCAPGADTLAGECAHRLGLRMDTYPANWAVYGKAAGPIRNQQMLDEGKPDIVWAFKSKLISRGTDHMISIAKVAGIPVYIVIKA